MGSDQIPALSRIRRITRHRPSPEVAKAIWIRDDQPALKGNGEVRDRAWQQDGGVVTVACRLFDRVRDSPGILCTCKPHDELVPPGTMAAHNCACECLCQHATLLT